MAVGPKSKIHTYKTQFRTNYYLYMPSKKRYRIAIWIAFFIFATIIAGQLAYPRDRGLPMASVARHSLTLSTHDQMAKVIVDQFETSKLKLTIGPDKTVEASLKSTGAEPNTEEMIAVMSDYPFWQRLIPGTILKPSPRLKNLAIYYSTEQLKKFADERSKELSFAPQNAKLAIKDAKLVLTEAIAGSAVDKNKIVDLINSAAVLFGQTTTLQIPSKRTSALVTSKDLEKVRQHAEVVLAHTIKIKADAHEFSPDKVELASWVVLATNDKGQVDLSIDSNRIKAYLSELNKKVGTPAGQTNITIVDGRETGRTTGAVGRAINIDVIADQLSKTLLVPPPTVSITAAFTDVQPGVIFNSKYTATQDGLRAYVNDTARAKNMRISIQQLDGEKWSASGRDTESIPSGSTYKLYVALVLFDRIDKGEIHWDDPMLDTTVAGCFERMTVASTNPCAEKWIAMFGRQYIDDFVHARGFSAGTTFTASDANRSTAADLTKYMIGLNDGSLIAGANRDRLLSSLGRHPYRYGIPTGSQGQVHDKVGFLWDYVHDTAIVNHPKGNYVMTIMTKGQSYAAIATTTREIERIMYP
jgi:beta-lactamase class A